MVGSAFVLSCANAPEVSEEETGVELKTFEDSLAYDFGAANSDLKTIAVMQFEVDTTCMDRFVKGMITGVENFAAVLLIRLARTKQRQQAEQPETENLHRLNGNK